MTKKKPIKTSVSKIDGIKKSVNLMTAQLSDLSIKVNDIDKRVSDTEQFNSFINSKYERQSLEFSTTTTDVNSLKEKCNSMKHTIKSLECTNAQIQAKVAENEFRSMRDNLIFYGISETAPIQVLSTQSNTDTFNGATSDDNIGMEPDEQEISQMSASTTDLETQAFEILVKQFIKDVLKLKADNIVFDRAHRLGNDRKSKKPRPIIVKFHYYNDRERIRKASLGRKDYMKANNVGVGVQLPKEWREARQKLYPIFNAEKRKGNNVKFIGEKLFINGIEFKSQYTNNTS